MLISELQDCLANIQYADRSLWESSRIQSYITCQINSRKKLKLTDVYKLPFDDADDEPLSIEDYEQMKERSQMLADYINSQSQTADKV